MRIWRLSGLAVDLGHQRACGIQIQKIAALGFGRHGLGHAMGGKNNVTICGNFVQFLHKDGTLCLQLLYNGAVMNDLVSNIDRRAVTANGFLHHTDGAVHPGTKAARASQKDLE